MEIATLMDQITEIENAITDAFGDEDYDLANKLSAQRLTLIQELCSIEVHDEKKQEIIDFITALKEHMQQQVEVLKENHDKIKKELIHFKKNQKGAQLYKQIRRT